MNSKIFFSVFLLNVFFAIHDTRAQTTIIELDTLTLSPSAALPFDEPFILKIPIKTDQPASAGYMGKNGGNVVNANSFVKKQGTQNYLFVYVENPNLLDPGRNYLFFWTEGVSDDVEEAFDDYDQFKRNRDRGAFDKAYAIVHTIALENFRKFGSVVIFDPKATDLKTLNGFYENADSGFPSKYKNYLDKLTAYAPVNTMRATLNSTVNLPVFIKTITEKSNNFDPVLKTVLFKDIRLAISRLTFLNDINDADYKDLLYGIKPLDCNACKAVKPLDYNSRLGNIKTTLLALNELYSAARALRDAPGMTTPIITLKNTIDEFNAALVNLQSVADARKLITSEIAKIGISNFNSVGGTTNIKSFDTRTKLSIAPDFGVVTTRLFSDGSNPYSFAPYLGFHVNFRPFNRDLAWKTYHHKFVSYFSAFVGWTLVNIKNGPHLTAKADSVNGFFTGDKGTLITGFGIRLGNVVRITTGAMYYFQYRQNSTNPTLYDTRKLKAWPFVGLSLDLAIKDLLNGISDVFTAAPRTYNPPPPTLPN